MRFAVRVPVGVTGRVRLGVISNVLVSVPVSFPVNVTDSFFVTVTVRVVFCEKLGDFVAVVVADFVRFAETD